MAKKLGYGDSFIDAVENNLGKQQGVGFLDIANSPKSAFETGMRLQIGDLQKSGKWDKMSIAQQNAAKRKIAKKLQKTLPKAGFTGDMDPSKYGIKPKGTPKNTRRTLDENTPKKRLSSAERKALKSKAQTPSKFKDIPLDQEPFETEKEKRKRRKKEKAMPKQEGPLTPKQQKAADLRKKVEEIERKLAAEKKAAKKTPAKKTPYQQGMEQGQQAGEKVTQKTKDVVDKGKDIGKKAAQETAETTARNTGRATGFLKGVKPLVKAAGPVGFVVGAGVDAIQMSDEENRAQAQKDIETPNTEGILRDRNIAGPVDFSPKAALDAPTGGIRKIWDDDATSPVELIVGGVRSLAEIAKEGEQPALDERMMYSGAGESMHNTVPAPPLDPSSKYFTKEESAAIFKDVQEKIAQEKAEKAEKAGKAKMDNITPAEMRSILGTSPRPTETSTSTNLSSKIPAPERTDKPTIRRQDRKFIDNLDLSVLDELVGAADEGEKDVPEPTDRPTELPDYFSGAGDMQRTGVSVPDSPLGVDVSKAPKAEVLSEDPEDYTDKAIEIFKDLHGGEFNPKSRKDRGELEKMKSMLADVGGIGDDKASVNKFALQFYRNS